MTIAGCPAQPAGLLGAVRRLTLARTYQGEDRGTVARFQPVNGISLYAQVARGAPTDRFLAHALRLHRGGGVDATIVRSGFGEPMIEDPGEQHWPAFSASTASGWRIVAIADARRTGVDAETLRRVSDATTVHDRWLSGTERRILARCPPGALVGEIACRWVLKEAYAKLRGRGLHLPIGTISFSAAGRRISVQAERPDDAAHLARCSFSLAMEGPMLLGMARYAE